MRFVVIGAGAVGGSIGARLFEAGHRVVLVARGPHLAALQAGGLSFATPERTVILPIPAVAGPDDLELTADDVLIVAVKTQDIAAVLRGWAPAVTHATSGSAGGTNGSIHAGGVDASAGQILPVVCAQNGVESERLALRSFARVYGMCVILPAAHLEPGLVAAPGDPLTGVLAVGRYPDGTDTMSAAITSALTGARFRGIETARVMDWKYAKLLSNLGNALDAVCGPLDDPIALGLLDRARAEGSEVFAAAGIATIDPAEEARERMHLRFGEIPGRPRLGGSTWQSLARGTGSVEVDYLAGEIVLLGRLHGVATPVNQTLQELANEAARTRARPGLLTAAEVAAQIDARERAALSR